MIPLFKVFMSDEARQKVQKVLSSGFIGQGPVVDQFEAALQEKFGVKNLVTVNSCTSALHAVLAYLGVGPGDEVITTALTCTATNAPIIALGARPVWADIDSRTGLITPEGVAAKVTPRTKAIIGVSWTGRLIDWQPFKNLGIPLIEDAAHGPLIPWRPGGYSPDFVCYSFGPIKHLTCGDGGAVVAKDPQAADVIRLMRWYGLDRRSTQDFRCAQDIKHPGLKWHMTDLNAAIGLGNLEHLDMVVGMHKQNAWSLHKELSRMYRSSIYLPPFDDHSNYWVFPVIVRGDRDRLKERLLSQGIMASQVHARNDKHSAFNYPNGPLPGLDKFDQQQLNIPCGWWVKYEDIEKMVDAFRDTY